MLKPNLDLDIYRMAKSLEDVAEKTESIVMELEISPDLKKYWQKIIKNLKFYKSNEKAKNLDNVIAPNSIEIIVTQLKNLENVVNLLDKTVEIRKDKLIQETHKRWIDAEKVKLDGEEDYYV